MLAVQHDELASTAALSWKLLEKLASYWLLTWFQILPANGSRDNKKFTLLSLVELSEIILVRLDE